MVGGSVELIGGLHVIGPDGQLRRSEHFMAPFASVVHDFAPTSKHIVFPVFPLTASMDRARKGLPAHAWEPELGSRTGIMPRDGSAADMRWFRGEASYVFHPLNAYDTPDGKIVAYMVKYDVPPGYLMADGSPARGRAGTTTLWRPGDGDYCGEAVFVPRSADAKEGEGWLLAVVYRGHEHRSDLVVLDALNVDRGPVAVVHLSHRAPAGIHGNVSELVVLDAADFGAPVLATVLLPRRVPFGIHANWFPAAVDTSKMAD
jgi:carotenoid cleavage dioxygenase-like enzyme